MQVKVIKLYYNGTFTGDFLFGGENKADGNKDSIVIAEGDD